MPIKNLFSAGEMASIQEQNLVLTPGGYRSKGQVLEVSSNDSIKLNRRDLQIVDNLTNKKTSLTTAIKDEDRVLFFQGGWVSYAHFYIQNGDLINSFESTWVVPPEPLLKADQTIFIFNGIQNVGPLYGILQPVLQWGVSAAGGGRYWSIASWYVRSDKYALHTPLIRVNVGDQLKGRMDLISRTGLHYNYTCEFKGINDTLLTVNNIRELVWCNHTVEAYDTYNCGDFPDIDKTIFNDISVITRNTAPPPIWSITDLITTCGQRCYVHNNGTNTTIVDIFYR